MGRSRLLGAVVVLVVLAVAPSAAHAARIFALTAPPVQLLSFGSSAPGTIMTSTPVTGLADGETVLGMDLRPADGGLYVLTLQGTTGHLRQLDPVTGALSAGVTLAADPTDSTSPYTGISSSAAGVDFNPVPDRLRIVTSTRANLRVNPATGLVITDADINPGLPVIPAVAYLNPYPGASVTTLYDYNFSDDNLDIQSPPNNGTLTSVGPSGITSGDPARIGMDIAADGNAAFLLTPIGPAGTPNLYSVNLGTGAATLQGTVGTGAVLVSDITAVENLIGFEGATVTSDEDRGTAQVRVQRDAPYGVTSISYATADGSATAGADYTAISGTLKFGDGEVSKTIEVPLTADATHEPDETFTVTLSAPTPGPGTTATPVGTNTTVTIADDDPDRDGDGIADRTDVCPTVADPGQADANGNGIGTACDLSETLADHTKPVVLLQAADITRAKLRSKGFPFRFSCSEACRFTLTLRVGTKKVGSARASLAAAGTRKGRARLTKKGKSAVLHARSLKLSASATDGAGNRGSDRLTVRLR